MQKLIFTFCMVLAAIFSANAQNVIQQGNFQCISLQGPLMYYWNNPNITAQFTKDLSKELLDKRGYTLNTNMVSFSILKSIADFSNPSNGQQPNSLIHFKLAEYPASLYLSKYYPELLNDSTQEKIQSILLLEMSIQNKNAAFEFSKRLEIFIKHNKARGIGIPFGNLHLTGKAFSELMKKSLEIILDSTNFNEQIELKVSPPMMGDNFIIGAISNLPKITIESQGLFSKYRLNNQSELIRWDEQRYQEIILRGKNRTVLPPLISNALSEITKEFPQSVYVYLLQDARNIVLNRNYQLAIPARVASAGEYTISALPLIEPLPGPVHVLQLEKDTIATFSIATNKKQSNQKYSPYISTNGFDSSSAVIISDQNKDLVYSSMFSLTGKIRDQSFRIEVGEFFRDIYLNEKRVLIIGGMQQPDRMVIFDSTLSNDFINELILLSYNRFFQ
jgi:hypothetical protein